MLGPRRDANGMMAWLVPGICESLVSTQEQLTGMLADLQYAHIHMGSATVAGPVVAFLIEPLSPPLTSPSILVSGRINSTDLVGPLKGMPFSNLTSQLAAGNLYGNMHTVQYPEGAARGQLMQVM